MPWLTIVWQWLLRLVGGWLPLGNKPVGEWLGKLLWAIGIFVGCTIFIGKCAGPTSSIKPHQDIAGDATTSYHQETLRPIGGCATLKIYEYYQDKKTEETKK